MRFAWLISVLCITSAATAAGLTDSVDLGDTNAPQSRQITSQGDVKIATAGDFVGGHDMRRPARIVGDGGAVGFELQVAPDEPLTLEIEEIDDRGSDVRGYQVLVDDKPAYFRTWRSCGAGPLHYFVQLPPPGRERVNVRFVNRSATPVAIARVWAWGDIEKFFDANGFAVPYHLAPTVPLSGDLAEDRAKIAQIKKSFGERANVKPAWTTWISYAAKSERQCAERIDEALKLAEDFDLPVQICFDSWWANTPSGPDGHGGRWTDVQYQQVVWNETHKRMELSIPNQWSSTPWLTMNHPDLNAFKAERIAAAASHLRLRLRDFLARGKRNLILAVNLDNEPIYWASGNAGLGSDLLWADFNPRTVAAAKADGVTLDPRDGLSRDERLWLWKNLLRYNDLIASSIVSALGRDACVVAKDSSEPARELLADNVYTQAMMMSDPQLQYPALDRAYPLWETAAPASCRVGGEWSGDALPERQGVEHQLPLGRNAAINAECENDAKQHRGVAPGYALGQRYYTPYNYPIEHLNVAAADVDDIARGYPAIVYEPTLFEHDFAGDDWKKRVVSHGGIETKLIGNTTAVAASPASSDTTGFVTYRIDTKALAGLALDLCGRANDFRGIDPAVQIRVLAGPSDDVAKMREITIISQSPELSVVHHVDLSEAARGSDALFVRIEMLAPTIPHDLLSWCSVHRVRFTTPWPKEVFEKLPKQDESLQLVRKQSLLISWRRDAELAIERLATAKQALLDKALMAARSAYDAGRYADGYRIAAEGACAMLPATFVVKESGELKPYPIRIEAASPVTIVVKKCSAEEVCLAGEVDHDASATIRIGGLVAGKHYALSSEKGDWTIQLSDAANAKPASETGEITFEAMFKASPAPVDRVASRPKSTTITGVVTAFSALTPYDMPSVALDNQPPRAIDLAAPIHVGEQVMRFKTSALGTLKIEPGRRVRLRVDAETNRVLELWNEQ